MRVTDAQMHRSMRQNVARALGQINEYQQEIATGRRFARPSQDPSGTMLSQKLQALLERNAQYQANVDDGAHWVAATEHPLGTVQELLSKLKEIALRGSDDSNGERGTLGTSVDQLLQELVEQANATDGDRYLFGGFRSESAPYAKSTAVASETFRAGIATEVDLANAKLAAGSVVVRSTNGAVTYREGVDYRIDYDKGRIEAIPGGAMLDGTDYTASYTTQTTSAVPAQGTLTGDILRQIGPERTEPVNLTGPEVFTNGSNLFQLAIDLKNALWKNDGDKVRSLLSGIDTAISNVGKQVGLLGARSAALETQSQLLASDHLALEDHLSQVRDADLPETMVRLQAQQNAYQAALAATSRMFQMSLTNFLR